MKRLNGIRALLLSGLVLLLLLSSGALAEGILESSRNGTKTWTSPIPGYVQNSMYVTFTKDSDFYSTDTICISNVMTGSGFQESYTLSGKQIAGKTVQVVGTDLTIQVNTVRNDTFVGYQVEKIECVTIAGMSVVFTRDHIYDLVIDGRGFSESWLKAMRDYKPDDYELGRLVIKEPFTLSISENLGIPVYENRGTIASGNFPDSIVYNYGTITGGSFSDVSNESTGVISGGSFNGTVYNGGTISGGEINGSLVQGALPDVSDFKYTTSNGEVTITGYSGSASAAAMVVPSKIGGKPVTALGNAVFSGCSGITSAFIPDSVTSIGNSVFSGCSKLSSISLPRGLTHIGSSCFYNCSSLSGIEIPAGVISIGGGAFQGCSALTGIDLPEGLTQLGGSAFLDCTGIGKLVIPDGVRRIGARTFARCTNLSSVSLPENLESIGENAFFGCSSLRSIDIPQSVTEIDRYAFNQCTGLTGITIPDGVTGMEGTFYKCTNLSSVTLPGNLTAIGDDCFRGCSSLAEISIPEGVCSIGSDAFYDCSSLRSIALPEGVRSIGYGAFNGCSSLRSIAIPDGVPSIQGHTFDGCSSLESVEIPESVTYIGIFAFDSCTGLTRIFIPHTVTEIESAAFDDCPANLVIACHMGSAAYLFATENQIATDADAHAYVGNGRIEPDCENPGGNKQICTICGHEIIEPEEALGHDYQVSAEAAPDCTEPGSVTYSCTRCGDSYDEEVDALGHDYQLSDCTATCVEAGVSTYTCTRCADFYTQNAAALGHKYENNRCIRCNQIKPPAAAPFRQEVMDSGYSVQLPAGAYRMAESNDEVHYWMCPNEEMLIGFEKVQYASLDVWRSLLTRNGYMCTFEQTQSGVTCLLAVKTSTTDYLTLYDAKCMFLSGNHTYSVGVAKVHIGQYYIYLDVAATLVPDVPVIDELALKLPKGTVEIEDYAFQNCRTAFVIIPDGCKRIGRGAFADNSKLGRVEIPASVTDIEDGAFDNCPYLVIYAPEGSAAIAYARAMGINCIQQ